MFGREVRAPIDLVFGCPDDSAPTNREGFVERQERLYREAYSLVRRHMGEQAQRRKKGYDMRVRPASFTVGSWVWYYSPRRYVVRSPKCQRNYSGQFLVIAVLCLVDVVIQRSARARPLVVHIDKVKPFLGEPPPSWVADETATKALLGYDSPARAKPTTDSFQSADEPDANRMPVDTGFGDDSPEPVGLLAARPASSSLSPSAPVFIPGRRRHGPSVPPADPPPTFPVGLRRSARERRLPARFRT